MGPGQKVWRGTEASPITTPVYPRPKQKGLGMRRVPEEFGG